MHKYRHIFTTLLLIVSGSLAHAETGYYIQCDSDPSQTLNPFHFQIHLNDKTKKVDLTPETQTTVDGVYLDEKKQIDREGTFTVQRTNSVTGLNIPGKLPKTEYVYSFIDDEGTKVIEIIDRLTIPETEGFSGNDCKLIVE